MVDVPGVELLSQLFKQRTGEDVSKYSYQYEDYLDPAVLPYISRDDYIGKYPENSNLTTESEVFEKLITSNRHIGVMIYGDSGIGGRRRRGLGVIGSDPGVNRLLQGSRCFPLCAGGG